MGLTHKQERYAQARVEGMNQSDAFRAAYDASRMKPETVWRRGHDLESNGKVRARIAELQERAMRRHDVTIDGIVGELAKIGFANMQDFMVVGDDGLPKLDWSMLTRDQAAALTEVTVDQIKRSEGEAVSSHVERVRFKIGDKRGALVDLGKHLGMFVDKHEVTGKDGGPIETAQVEDKDVAMRIAFILESAARGAKL